jgi:hypothetical protein
VALREQLRHAAQYWKTDGPVWVARVAAEKVVELLWFALPPLTYRSVRMFLRLGYWPDIRNPRTFNEKVAHRQIFAPHPLASVVADKWRVRQYVAERGLEGLLNDVYFATDDPAKIPFDDLPDRFVIKANHGCHWNIFVRDKQLLDRQSVIRQCRRWLSTKYDTVSYDNETHYRAIPPLILVEKLVDDGVHDFPLDYKLFCFHQTAHFVQVDIGRHAKRTKTIYDREWRDTGIQFIYPRGELVPRPPRLSEMLQVAERLSGDFDFCRVDLYAPDAERILFGEITMSPAGGLGRFTPREWDHRLGELW